MFRFIVAAGLLLFAAPLAAQATDSLPSGATPDMVAEGKKVFAGAGLCSACHGPAARGTPGLGPNLTDAEWLHSDGSFEALVAMITTGVPSSKSKSGVAMPAKGGANLTDAQVRAVAAYVWTLSRASK